jgi:phosphonate transport system ATP-binding protein
MPAPLVSYCFTPAADILAVLTISELCKTYDTGDVGLDRVSLDVGAGEMIALIGPSGAGKSTLIRCINRLVEPTSGSVRLHDVDVTTLGRRRLRAARRKMAMIFQEYALVERLSVMENVLAGQLGNVSFLRSLLRRFPEATVAEAFELLARVELESHYMKRADELSGGQRQRVGIARAVLQRPDLLLVDEPTASLDPRTSRQIMRLLVEICKERQLAAIVNIHDVALARTFIGRIVGLRDGAIVFDGGPDELDEDRLSDIYGKEDWQATGAEPSAMPDEVESAA